MVYPHSDRMIMTKMEVICLSICVYANQKEKRECEDRNIMMDNRMDDADFVEQFNDFCNYIKYPDLADHVCIHSKV